MTKLAGMLGIGDGSVVAVIGCGGKTSLIRLLAEENPNRKVLISPTTKMYPIEGTAHCAGVMDRDTGKLLALPMGKLAGLARGYDLVLLEADGSRGLPLKGWRVDEPVIPDFCTHTVGVVSVKSIGLAATSANVLRLPRFLELTCLTEGGIVGVDALASMIGEDGGMFKNAVGRCCLLVNQVENEDEATFAIELLNSVKRRWPGRFCRMLYGSVHENNWFAL